MYDAHILRSHPAVLPTLCVGNLAVGGTGKTPHIEWLIEQLRPSFRLAIVSRGYKRKSRGLVEAFAGSTAADIGDECMQLHIKYEDVVIVVCTNRHTAIEYIKKKHPEVQLVLLDDAFQFRHLKADFNMLLTTADNPFYADRMLPLGSLRDSEREKLRADVVVVTKCPQKMSPIERRNMTICMHLPAYQHLFFSTMQYAPLPDKLQKLSPESKILLLTGIAQPDDLKNYIRQHFRQVEHLRFADHHNFSPKEIEYIKQKAEQADAVVTTEKDLARLSCCDLPEDLSGKLTAIRVYPVINDCEELIRLIMIRFKKLTQTAER